MKLRVYITLLFCWLGCVVCFGQVSKTLHQNFMLDGAERINLNLVAKNIELKETKGTRVLVVTKVTISLPNERLLDFVCNTGRYDLIATIDETTNELTISSQKTNDVLIVKGEECLSTLEYTIFLPSNVKFINNSTLVNGDE